MVDEKAGWPRDLDVEPPSARQVAELLARAVPGHHLVFFEPLPGGLSNAMFRVHVTDLTDSLVLRIYRRDPAGCRKEAEIQRLIGARVPVPEVLYADFGNASETGPHMVMRWIEGITFRQIKQRGDALEIAESARAIGEVLAAIGTFTFDRPGMIGPDLRIGAPIAEDEHPIPAFVEKCMASPEFQRRMDLRDRVRLRDFIWRWDTDLAALNDQRSLVHSDFGSPNLLLRPIGGRCAVVGVLDWEFAFSGSPLCDVGHMMRYERRATPRIEPHFSAAFREHGGVLPANWRELSRVLDLAALCEFLTRPALPADVIPEILELTLATVEEREMR